MNSFVIVTYWWGDQCANSVYDYVTRRKRAQTTYAELVNTLRKQCEEWGLLFDAMRVQTPDYQLGISLKPIVIEYMLRKWKRPVLYIDCDMRLHRVPDMIAHAVSSFDFMAFNWYADHRATETTFDWHTLFSSGGVLFFNYTRESIRFLCLWKLSVLADTQKADDRVLDMCFKQFQKYLRYYWLPVEYCYIPRYMRVSPRRVVVSHPFDLSENLVNRLPAGYNQCVQRTDDYTHVVEYIPSEKKKWLRFIRARNKQMRLPYKVVFT